MTWCVMDLNFVSVITCCAQRKFICTFHLCDSSEHLWGYSLCATDWRPQRWLYRDKIKFSRKSLWWFFGIRILPHPVSTPSSTVKIRLIRVQLLPTFLLPTDSCMKVKSLEASHLDLISTLSTRLWMACSYHSSIVAESHHWWLVDFVLLWLRASNGNSCWRFKEGSIHLLTDMK